MPKVVHIQYQTESAANPALRLQQEFLKNNIDSNIISLKSKMPAETEGVISLGKVEQRISGIDYKLQSSLFRNTNKQFGMFSYPLLGINIANLKKVKEADYIYIHWVQNGFLTIRNLEQLAKLGKPVIFFMHDMWHISGGCHYSFDCDRYTIGCGNCQIFSGRKVTDRSKKEFKQKKKFYDRYDNLYFVSHSKWLFDCSSKSLLTKNKPLFYIPNLLSTKIFNDSYHNAKEILGIEAGHSVIAFGANAIDSPYKGWIYFQQALSLLAEKKKHSKEITVLLFGSGDKKLADLIPFKTKSLGFLSDEEATALAYNAADVFVVPSLADNQPTTVQESLSCGTAVVGFHVGGIPDMVSHKNNGYLAKYKDAEDLASGILYCLDNNIKGYRLSSFEPELVIESHLAMFEKIDLQRAIK